MEVQEVTDHEQTLRILAVDGSDSLATTEAACWALSELERLRTQLGGLRVWANTLADTAERAARHYQQMPLDDREFIGMLLNDVEHLRGWL